MKKMRMAMVALVALFAMAFVIGCQNNVASRDGTYNLVSVSMNGSTVTSASGSGWTAIPDAYKTLTVSGSNITYGGTALTESQWNAGGATFAFSGNDVTVTLTSGGQTATYLYRK